MTPEAKMSSERPYRWFGAVVLTPQDVKALLKALPKGSDLRARLQVAAQAASQLAMKLNEVDERGGALK